MKGKNVYCIKQSSSTKGSKSNLIEMRTRTSLQRREPIAACMKRFCRLPRSLGKGKFQQRNSKISKNGTGTTGHGKTSKNVLSLNKLVWV